MKKLFLLTLCCILSNSIYAGKIFIRNNTHCEILMEIQAQQAGYACNIYQQVPFTLGPNSSVTFEDFFAVTWQSTVPDLDPDEQVWDVVKFGFVDPESECSASGNVGIPACGWSYTWSSGSCSCYGATLYAKWTMDALGNVEVVFHN